MIVTGEVCTKPWKELLSFPWASAGMRTGGSCPAGKCKGHSLIRHSISTFWFALKEPYRCHRTRFAGQNITKCICGRGSAPDPSRRAYSASLDPLAGFNGRARWIGEGEMGREGKNGREKGDRKEGGLCLLQKFLRAPMFLHTICETVLRYFSCSLLSRLTSLLRLLFYRLHRD